LCSIVQHLKYLIAQDTPPAARAVAQAGAADENMTRLHIPQ
jgi:hypothetical protein